MNLEQSALKYEWVTNGSKEDCEKLPWMKTLVLGPPKATNFHTTEQLLAMQIVGWYRKSVNQG